MQQTPSILWLTNNLRLDDNPALVAACDQGSIIPLFIWDDSVTAMGGAARVWLGQAIASLATDLAKHKIDLVLRRGDPLEILTDIAKASGAQTIHASKRYEPDNIANDTNLALALNRQDLTIHFHPGFLLFEPDAIQNKSGTSFKVYSPFARACFAAPAPARPQPTPRAMTSVANIASDRLQDWSFAPPHAQWPQRITASWDISESAAHARLHHFKDKHLSGYKDLRDRPDIDGTSRLSPYLHFGQISPRRIWCSVSMGESGGEKYLREILWREFSWHLLAHIPNFTHEPLQKSFNAFPWREDPAGLHAWQRGQTGYPIVDAGMRQLWQTGWMHNRVRMITASFLIKDLLIDWRRGMEWFWDTLVDADLGNNTASWQWVAGCGADAAPYFRIFNPILQGLKFDPNGDYVRAFVPELATLPTEFIHEPWKAPAETLKKAGVILGQTYPNPIVDHAKARDRALNALKISKNEGGLVAETTDLFS